MRVLVLVDREQVDPADPEFRKARYNDESSMEWNIVSTLRLLDHQVSVLPFERQNINALTTCKTDLVFNLTEHMDNDRRKDVHIARLLERLSLTYTGAGPRGLALSRDKAKSKRLLRHAGFDVPDFEVLDVGKLRLTRPLRFPVIVKPLLLDASEGITRSSLAFNTHSAMRRTKFLHRTTGQAVICEEYIEGRELKVSILGNRHPVVLPPREVVFPSPHHGGPSFLTSRVKNDAKYRRTWGITYPKARLSPSTLEHVAAAAVRMYLLLQMRDYGKIDLRLSPEGGIFFLEGNPNPDLSPSGFGSMASWAGISYRDLIRRIVQLALERSRQEPGLRTL
jgi:D-alanine-D-alanine ligase